MSDLPQLSKRERQIMDIVFAQGEVTASGVMEAMPDALSRAAVRTFLRILEDKGHLQHRLEGREFVFQPTQARTQVGQSAFQRVLDVFFSGSLEQAVAAHLAEKEHGIDPAELEKMASLIRQARKQGR